MAEETTWRRGRRSGRGAGYDPVERADAATLRDDLRCMQDSPFVDGVLHAAGGLLAILNEQRQIVVLNEAFTQRLGIDDPQAIFGLRLGEAIHCVHAHDVATGCGTGPYCATCGATIAMLATLHSDTPQRRSCVATLQRAEGEVDLYFQVQCVPMALSGHRFLLVFLQDETVAQQRAALEKVFFHDLQNVIAALTLETRLLAEDQDAEERAASCRRVARIAAQLAQEVEVQRVLVRDRADACQLHPEDLTVAGIVAEVRDLASRHPVASGKALAVSVPSETIALQTDAGLVQRVLLNMLLNALEATRPQREASLTVTDRGEAVCFAVWNEIPIPESIALRVFQRHFSTRSGADRGWGTYTMKLFGETYLGGSVTFTSSAAAGTEFRFVLPKTPPAGRRASPTSRPDLARSTPDR